MKLFLVDNNCDGQSSYKNGSILYENECDEIVLLCDSFELYVFSKHGEPLFNIAAICFYI